MTKSKSKARPSRAPRWFVAVHQDVLMEAFARGFVAPVEGGLVAESTVTLPAVERAMAGVEWGDVVLLEVSGPKQSSPRFGIEQPLLLSDVIACWTKSEDSAAEINARLETFDDVVPGLVKIEAGGTIFPRNEKGAAMQDPLPLGQSATAEQPVEPADMRDALELEKVAGALSMLRARATGGALGIESLAAMLAGDTVHAGPYSGIEVLASRAYRLVRPDEAGRTDERMFVQAAVHLKRESPRRGFDPIEFVARLGDSEEVGSFLDTLRKLLDNRIELSDSKLDDSGKPGQRALLVFLLASRAEELERWLRARPVGRGVSMLASMLTGIYCGVGTIPAKLKGPSCDAFLATVSAASSLVDGSPPELGVTRLWDADAALFEGISISGRALVERRTPPAEVLSKLLATVRDSGLAVDVDPGNGRCTVGTSLGGMAVQISIESSAFRVPARPVVRLVLSARGAKRGQPSKEVMLALLTTSLRPLVGSVDGAGLVGLELELDDAASVKSGVVQLQDAARSLGLVQEDGAAKGKGRKVVASAG